MVTESPATALRSQWPVTPAGRWLLAVSPGVLAAAMHGIMTSTARYAFPDPDLAPVGDLRFAMLPYTITFCGSFSLLATVAASIAERRNGVLYWCFGLPWVTFVLFVLNFTGVMLLITGNARC